MKQKYGCYDCGYTFVGDDATTAGTSCPECGGRIIPVETGDENMEKRINLPVYGEDLDISHMINEAKVAVERLNLEPDSVIVIKARQFVLEEVYDRMAEQLKEWLEAQGLGMVKVLFITSDIDLAVLSEADMLRAGWKKV